MRSVAVVLGLLAACGGKPATAVQAPKAQPDIDPATAEKDAKGLVGEVSMSIGNGDTDGLMTLLSDKLVVFGPRKTDALSTRTDALVALGKVVDAKNKRPLKLDERAMVAAPGGHSAWAFDVIDAGNGPMAVTAILSNTDDIWLIDAVSIGNTEPSPTLRAAAAKDALVPPALGPAKLDGDTKAVVERFQHGLVDQDAWGDDLAMSEQAIFAGPMQGEIARGKTDIKKAWAKRTKDGTREIVVGELSAAVMPDGRLAWVSAPVTRVAETGESLPLRAFAVFEQHEGTWRMVALQESVAIDAPGSGVAFHRAAPPPPPPPVVEKPVEKVAVADKPAPKKAKKVTAKPKKVEADEDAPKPKKRKFVKKAADDDAADEAPKPKKKIAKKKPVDDDDADEAPKPKKKIAKKKPVDDDDADEAPKPKKKVVKKKPASDDDDADEAPKPKKKVVKKKPASDDDDADEAPKPKKKAVKKKPASDDDDDVSVSND